MFLLLDQNEDFHNQKFKQMKKKVTLRKLTKIFSPFKFIDGVCHISHDWYSLYQVVLISVDFSRVLLEKRNKYNRIWQRSCTTLKKHHTHCSFITSLKCSTSLDTVNYCRWQGILQLGRGRGLITRTPGAYTLWKFAKCPLCRSLDSTLHS